MAKAKAEAVLEDNEDRPVLDLSDTKVKKYLKHKLRFVPNNYYTTWTTTFGLSFALGFAVQNNIDNNIKIGVISVALAIIAMGILMDARMKRQGRTFSF